LLPLNEPPGVCHDAMPALDKPPIYRSYLLRLWEERSEQPAMRVWRFSLEDPLTTQQHHFASLEALTAWLRTEMSNATQSPDPTL
jgi:hypothetical protein